MTRGHDALLLSLQTSELQKGLNVASIGLKAQIQLRELLGLTASARTQAIQHHIRKSLAFTEMYERSEVNPNAHRDTFAWLLDQDDPPDTAPEILDARRRFQNWLATGAGIFHVIGKIGSGKSTLMKFLANDPRTRTMLFTWADPRKLVLVKFYFWKPAQSRLPRSVPGLLRTLAYDILKEAPDLTSIMLPTQWSKMNALESLHAYDCGITDAEVEVGLKELFRHPDVQANYRFCFFVDALDELDEGFQDTHQELVRRINKWTADFAHLLKICVSSREHNGFDHGFDAEQRMRLQDLTRGDMLRVADQSLRIVEVYAQREGLIKTIVDRSEGVFLWVALVLKNIRQGLDDGWSLTHVETEIESSPIELDDFYSHLLRSISKTQKRRAYQSFTMVSALADSWSGRFSLKACLYIEKYEQDSQFALELHPSDSGSSEDEMSYKELHQQHAQKTNRALKIIRATCKGMLEIRDHRGSEYAVPHQCVFFVHRSAIEYLRLAEAQSILADDFADEPFDVVEAISQIYLAEFKEASPRLLVQDFWEIILLKIVGQRAEAKIDRAPYAFLEDAELSHRRKFQDREVPMNGFVDHVEIAFSRLMIS